MLEMNYYREVYLKSDDWLKIKIKKAAISKRCCGICSATQNIDLHHLFYRDNLNEVKTSDLRWLCRRCHEKAHELIQARLIVFGSGWSHQKMFGHTKSLVRQSLGIVRIAINKNSEAYKELESAKSERGGYTRETVQKLGIEWPLKRGWKKRFLRNRFAQSSGLVLPS